MTEDTPFGPEEITGLDQQTADEIAGAAEDKGTLRDMVASAQILKEAAMAELNARNRVDRREDT